MTRLTRNLWVSGLLILSDFIGFTLAIYIAMGILQLTLSHFHDRIPEVPTEGWISLHWMLACCCTGWFAVRLRHYFYRKTFWFELKEILRTLLIFAVFEIAIVAFAKWYFSRYLWVLTWLLVLLLVPALRMLTKKLLDKAGLWQRDAIIIGSGKNAIDAYQAITSEKNLGFRVTGFINTEPALAGQQQLQGIPLLDCNPGWLGNGVDRRQQFIVAVESQQAELRNRWLREMMIKGYRYVSVIPTLRGMPLDSTDMSFIFSHEVMIFRVHQNLAKWSSRALKRGFDICASLAIIILLSPLLLYIRSKVRKDGGPAIYGHERIGQHGKPFKCLKFRSMAVNSGQLLEELLASDPEAKAEWDATFKLKNDPRITRIGDILRRTSMDELPQLFNVLKGEMSLVGPRPIIQQELERYHEQVDYYLMSKPGMTGLWQVSGRSDVDYETRVYFDAWYVKNWSMWNDIAILFKTVGVVLKRDGAY
ncbi:undecaprenyl-phosphate galactose phosphotransferase WbaP [Tatumella sp. JGM130]|uniref:undecaprenyl-phosphate galactose phosphotransferase WbaP n=1 Tax=Tatumella sp. JGM130 TaxID=2799797 RepID=UPI001BAF848D|nr:undecaprenyl-phosphate galactose phosphotransferase WbaP [Tatumella sp. JGM130]MBS0894958.1 undecaprenyl-phosphate galactose phosphotransferase WbaP [Tatumella sp. JGM130]